MSRGCVGEQYTARTASCPRNGRTSGTFEEDRTPVVGDSLNEQRGEPDNTEAGELSGGECERLAAPYRGTDSAVARKEPLAGDESDDEQSRADDREVCLDRESDTSSDRADSRADQSAATEQRMEASHDLAGVGGFDQYPLSVSGDIDQPFPEAEEKHYTDQRHETTNDRNQRQRNTVDTEAGADDSSTPEPRDEYSAERKSNEASTRQSSQRQRDITRGKPECGADCWDADRPRCEQCADDPEHEGVRDTGASSYPVHCIPLAGAMVCFCTLITHYSASVADKTCKIINNTRCKLCIHRRFGQRRSVRKTHS